MLKAALKGVFAHKLRLALTAASIMLGVGFVASAFIFTDTINGAFEDLFSDAFAGTDVEVRVKDAEEFEGSRSERISEDVLATVRGVDGVEDAFGTLFGLIQLADAEGELVQTGGAPSFATNWVDQIEASAFKLQDGAPPGPDEAVIDASTSRRFDIGIGDEVTVLSEREPRKFAISGLAGFGEADNLGGAVFVLLETSAAQEIFDAEDRVDDISVIGAEGVDAELLASNIQDVIPDHLEAITSQSAAEEASAEVKDQLGFLQTFLLVFAGVSLFVGTFIIQNTFRIIVAQRTRELGLLRAVGAYPRQIMVIVIVEALVVAIVASGLGVIVGIGLATGIRSLLEAFGRQIPEGPLIVMIRTVVVAVVVGLAVTVTSAILPARRASKVSPVAAIRETDPEEAGSMRLRWIIGIISSLLGVGLIGAGLFADVPPEIPEIALVGTGAGMTFIGIAVLSPFFATGLVRVLGWPVAKVYRIVGDLSKENSARNPRRTSATAAALMIGVALVTVVSTLAASAGKTATKRLDDVFKADLVVANASFGPFGFSSEIAPRIEALEEVELVHRERRGRAMVEGRTATITGVDLDSLEVVGRMIVVDGDLEDLQEPGSVALSEESADGSQIGDEMPAEFAFSGEQPLTVVAIFSNSGSVPGARVVSMETFDANFLEVFDSSLEIVLAPGVSLQAGKDAVGQVLEDFPNVALRDSSDLREEAEGQLGGLLNFIQALLGLAILIAVLGIANTLSLSIIERTREIGLLRAVGMSRRQIRKIVRWEAVIIALFGGVVGVIVGLGFARAVVSALAEEGFTEFAIPMVQVGGWLLAAGFAGIIAAVLPAWKASRLDVLEAISYE